MISVIGMGLAFLGRLQFCAPAEHDPYGTDPWRGSWQESDNTCDAWNKAAARRA